MQRLDSLREAVEGLYRAHNPEADPWIDWAYENHVLFVADMTGRLATRYGADAEPTVAGALLHDIADAVMLRSNPAHPARSLELASELLEQSGFAAVETEFIINEVIKPHSCYEPLLPTTPEGKVMATADGAAHFLTDFYPLFCWRHYGPENDYDVFKAWMLRKMEKDFHKKLFFDEVRKEVRPRYEALKLIFA